MRGLLLVVFFPRSPLYSIRLLLLYSVADNIDASVEFLCDRRISATSTWMSEV
jgi:hypothetical protein